MKMYRITSFKIVSERMTLQFCGVVHLLWKSNSLSLGLVHECKLKHEEPKKICLDTSVLRTVEKEFFTSDD
jgi:hypothetical protein